MMNRRAIGVAAIVLFFLLAAVPVNAKPIEEYSTFESRWYYQNGLGVSQPIKWAKVEVYKATSSSGPWNYAFQGCTNDNGIQSATVDGGYYYKAKLWCQSYDTHPVSVLSDFSTSSVYKWWSDVAYVPPEGSGIVTKTFPNTGNDWLLWAGYNHIRNAHIKLETTTGWSAPTAYAVCPVPSLGPPAAYYALDNQLRFKTYTFFGDSSIVYHEYGHFVDHKINGFPAIHDLLNPPAHYLYTEWATSESAFVEGWAEFFAAWVANDPNIYTNYVNGAERGIDWNGWAEVIDGGMDGAQVEGAVAAILWDIYDGISASDYPPGDSTGDYYQAQSGFLWIWHVMDVHDAQTLCGWLNNFRAAYQESFNYYTPPYSIMDLDSIYSHTRCQ